MKTRRVVFPGENLFTHDVGSLKQFSGVPSCPFSLSGYFLDAGERPGSMDRETREEKIPENIDQWTCTNMCVCICAHV